MDDQATATRNLRLFNLARLPTPVVSSPPPGRVLKGTPEFRTWVFDRDEAGLVTSGLWEATPGSWTSSKEGAWEFATILSGLAELSEGGQPAITLRAGGTVVLRPDFSGVWTVIETIRKLWVIRDRAAA